MSEFIAEIIGTFILIYLGGGVVAGSLLPHSKSEKSGWIVIALAWGLAVTMAIYAVGNFSGAHINPAVTLGLAAAGEFNEHFKGWEDVPIYCLGQLLGAMIGALMVYFHFLPHWSKTDDKELKLGVFATIPAIRNPFSNLFSEIMGTFILLFLLMAIGSNEFTKGLNPIVVGLLVLVIGLSLGGTTGYAINPARDLGPRIMHFLLPIPNKGTSDWRYSWIPIVGPISGGILGALSYKALFENEISTFLYLDLLFVIACLAIAFIKK
jgi:glycerol uptake facilitator protein